METIMTDEQIIKALEYCSTDVRENTCPQCAFYKKHRCSTLMLNAASDLINRQKAEIERLAAKILVKDNINAYNTAQLRIAREELRTAKSEVIKEFAEQLKETADYIAISGYRSTVVDVDSIDNLVKEMTE